MTDDLTALTSQDHFLEWLGDDPGKAVRDAIESLLVQQVPSTRLEWVRLEGTPYFLTGGRELKSLPGQLLVTRTGVAVAFELQVSTDKQDERLRGVFTWVAIHLDDPDQRNDQVFLDLNVDQEQAETYLKLRLYGVDLEPDESGDPDEPDEPDDPGDPAPRSSPPWWAFWRR